MCHHLQAKISQWRDVLPPHFSGNLDAVLLPADESGVQYHALASLLHRPFDAGRLGAIKSPGRTQCSHVILLPTPTRRFTKIDAILRPPDARSLYCNPVTAVVVLQSVHTYICDLHLARYDLRTHVADTKEVGGRARNYSVAHRRLRNYCLEILSGGTSKYGCQVALPRRTPRIPLKLMAPLGVQVERTGLRCRCVTHAAAVAVAAVPHFEDGRTGRTGTNLDHQQTVLFGSESHTYSWVVSRTRTTNRSHANSTVEDTGSAAGPPSPSLTGRTDRTPPVLEGCPKETRSP
ncbi:hypothetical protein PG996_007757 [Apiospora saccharicola]|uniref:Uncharacterized protein n=1 Tax=Apiospora saccharicola TaxID=335842 RepID=A0ABR1VEI7_9PEZI